MSQSESSINLKNLEAMKNPSENHVGQLNPTTIHPFVNFSETTRPITKFSQVPAYPFSPFGSGISGHSYGNIIMENKPKATKVTVREEVFDVPPPPEEPTTQNDN